MFKFSDRVCISGAVRGYEVSGNTISFSDSYLIQKAAVLYISHAVEVF